MFSEMFFTIIHSFSKLLESVAHIVFIIPSSFLDLLDIGLFHLIVCIFIKKILNKQHEIDI